MAQLKDLIVNGATRLLNGLNVSGSVAEGSNTQASGNNSHAEGYGTIASGDESHVQGKDNVEDTNNTYADIVGNGTSDNARSNAYALDWNGNGHFAGDVYVGCEADSSGGSQLISMEKLNKIFGTSYSLSLTITNGTFTDSSTNAHLLGNIVRIYINCTAKAAKTAGNITNETMMTISFTEPRIKYIWNISNSGGTSGPNSQISLSCSSSNGVHTITVTLAALAQNLAKDGAINSYVAIPCTLNLDAF